METLSNDMLALLGGGAIGVILALIPLLVIGFSGLGRADRPVGAAGLLTLSAGYLTRHALAVLGIIALAVFLYTLLTLAGLIVGRALGVAESFVWAAVVFLGHRCFLASRAAEAGLEAPKNGILAVFARSLLFAAVFLVILAVMFGMSAVITSLFAQIGLFGPAVDLILGVLAGGVSIWISVLFAQMSFAYPSASIGSGGWLISAIQKARGIGMELAAALWVIALIAISLLIVIFLVGDAVMARTMLPTDFMAWDGDLEDLATATQVVIYVLVVEIPMNAMLALYMLASIACVSSAYDIKVLGPAIETATPKAED